MNSSSFHERHVALFDPKVLESKRVLIVGAGSVGSVLAQHLVRAGILELTVWDFDHVAESNLCRTVYTEADIDKAKVEALAAHLEAVRSGTSIAAEAIDVSELDDEQLTERLERFDLVIATTDHPETQARLGMLTYHRVPALFIGVYAKGTGGEVLFTLPDETACYHCVLGAIRAGARRPDRGQTDYGIATGQLASEPALGVDLAHVTTCGATVALGLVLRGTSAAAARIIRPERSVLFVGNAVDWVWNAPFETVWARTERQRSCICRLSDGESAAGLALEPEQPCPKAI